MARADEDPDAYTDQYRGSGERATIDLFNEEYGLVARRECSIVEIRS